MGLGQDVEAPRIESAVAGGAIGSFLLTGVNNALGLVSGVLLARLLGPSSLGLYASCMALASIVSVFAALGLPVDTTRLTASYCASGHTALLRGLVRWALQAVLTASILCGVVGLALTSRYVSQTSRGEVPFTAVAIFLLVPLMSLTAVTGGILRGLQHVLLAQVPEYIVRPVVFVLGCTVLLALPTSGANADVAIVMNLAAFAACCGAGSVLLRSKLRSAIANGPRRYERRSWLTASLPLMLLSLLDAFNSNIAFVALPLLAPSSEAGFFRVAVTAIPLLALAPAAIEVPTAPIVARLYQRAESHALKHIIHKVVLVSVCTAALPGLVLILAGRTLIGLIFGPSFEPAYVAMVILIVASLVTIALGPTIILLTMTGHGRDAASAVAAAAGVNVIGSIVLVPFYGAEGAAIAVGLSMVTWKTIMLQRVKARLRISPSLLGAILQSRNAMESAL